MLQPSLASVRSCVALAHRTVILTPPFTYCVGLRRCPVGRCDYDNPPRRCRVAEQLFVADDYVAPCRNADAGCAARIQRRLLPRHEAGCALRRVPCPDGRCDRPVRMAALLGHLRSAHGVGPHSYVSATGGGGGDEAACCFPLRPGHAIKHWAMLLANRHGADFVLQLKVDAAGKYKAWVHLLGAEPEEFGYRAAIRVARGGRTHAVTDCSVYPVDRSVEEVMAAADCFELSEKQAEQCLETPATDEAGRMLPEYVGLLMFKYVISRRRRKPQTTAEPATTVNDEVFEP